MFTLLSPLLLLNCAAPSSAESGRPGFLSAMRSQRPPPFEGAITEVVDVSGYTYAKVQSPSGPGRWTVTLGKPLQLGQQVRVQPYGELATFTSKQSGRTFAPLIFASLRSL